MEGLGTGEHGPKKSLKSVKHAFVSVFITTSLCFFFFRYHCDLSMGGIQPSRAARTSSVRHHMIVIPVKLFFVCTKGIGGIR